MAGGQMRGIRVLAMKQAAALPFSVTQTAQSQPLLLTTSKQLPHHDGASDMDRRRAS